MPYIGATPSKVPLTSDDIAPNTITNDDLAGSITSAKITSLEATKLTGSIADARVPASAVTQHVTATDLTPVRQDLAMLAIYNSVSDNRAAYNLPSSFIDTFQDDTGLTTQTDVDRNATGEYVSSSVQGVGNHVTTLNGAVTRSSAQSKFGGYSMYNSSHTMGLSVADSNDFDFGSGNFTIEYFQRPTAVPKHIITRDMADYPAFLIGSSNGFWATSAAGSFNMMGGLAMGTPTLNVWQHDAIVREGNTFTTYRDGTRTATSTASGSLLDRAGDLNIGYEDANGTHNNFLGYMDEVRFSKGIARYSGASYTVPTAQFVTDAYTTLLLHMDDVGLSDSHVGDTVNATGTLISDTQTASVSTTSMSGCILYKDNAGTATLGTHLKIYLSANGGTNWTEVPSYGAVTPLFSTGVKMVRLPKTTVTSGSTPVMKAVWAGQSVSLDTQLHGWAMNY